MLRLRRWCVRAVVDRADSSGGGPRHGVGKWRTRELFIAERRTCSLDHTRQASAADMVCTFGRVTDFPPPGPLHARILQRCRSVFVNCMLANLASPEMLEVREYGMSTLCFVGLGLPRLGAFTAERLTVSQGGTAGLTKHEDIVAMSASPRHFAPLTSQTTRAGPTSSPASPKTSSRRQQSGHDGASLELAVALTE